MRFFIVDAFTDALFGGNPAGVVVVENGADFPAEEVMRKTAAELRYSETAFIRKTGENTFHTRYFTPEAEVDLCGHATVGTFYALLKAGILKQGTVCRNQTLACELNIDVLEDSILMDMGTPATLGKIETQQALSELYGVMGLIYEERHTRHAAAGMSAAGVGGGTGGVENKEVIMLPELVSTGLPDIMMPVADEAALAAIKPDFAALAALSKQYQVVGVHAFTLNTKDGKVHCRNFAPLYAIDEEAATGTSNGALTYYLYQNGWIGDGVETMFIQGEAMGRPSRIISKLSVAPTSADTGAAGECMVSIRIGGKAVIVAEGNIRL